SRRGGRFDHIRGGELPYAAMGPPAVALDQRLHADSPGPHAAADPFLAHRRTAGLSWLCLLHRRHRPGRAAQSDLLAVLCGLACRGGGELRSDLPGVVAVPVSVQSARRQWRFYLPDHAGADPARLARAYSIQLHAVWLLGADFDRSL